MWDVYARESVPGLEQNNETRPRIPMAVVAGLLTGFSDSIKSSDCEQMPIIKAFPPYDCTMTVKGDSMEPEFEGGDETAIRKVCDVMEWGKTYVLDTRDGAVLKRLYDNGDNFKCVYIKFSRDKTDEANRKVIDCVSGKANRPGLTSRSAPGLHY